MNTNTRHLQWKTELRVIKGSVDHQRFLNAEGDNKHLLLSAPESSPPVLSLPPKKKPIVIGFGHAWHLQFAQRITRWMKVEVEVKWTLWL